MYPSPNIKFISTDQVMISNYKNIRSIGLYRYVVARSCEDLSYDDIYKALTKFTSHPESLVKSVHPIGNIEHDGTARFFPFQTKLGEVCQNIFEDTTCVVSHSDIYKSTFATFDPPPLLNGVLPPPQPQENSLAECCDAVLYIWKRSSGQDFDYFKERIHYFRKAILEGASKNSGKVDIFLEENQGKGFISNGYIKALVSIP